MSYRSKRREVSKGRSPSPLQPRDASSANVSMRPLRKGKSVRKGNKTMDIMAPIVESVHSEEDDFPTASTMISSQEQDDAWRNALTAGERRNRVAFVDEDDTAFLYRTKHSATGSKQKKVVEQPEQLGRKLAGDKKTKGKRPAPTSRTFLREAKPTSKAAAQQESPAVVKPSITKSLSRKTLQASSSDFEDQDFSQFDHPSSDDDISPADVASPRIVSSKYIQASIRFNKAQRNMPSSSSTSSSSSSSTVTSSSSSLGQLTTVREAPSAPEKKTPPHLKAQRRKQTPVKRSDTKDAEEEADDEADDYEDMPMDFSPPPPTTTSRKRKKAPSTKTTTTTTVQPAAKKQKKTMAKQKTTTTKKKPAPAARQQPQKKKKQTQQHQKKTKAKKKTQGTSSMLQRRSSSSSSSDTGRNPPTSSLARLPVQDLKITKAQEAAMLYQFESDSMTSAGEARRKKAVPTSSLANLPLPQMYSEDDEESRQKRTK